MPGHWQLRCDDCEEWDMDVVALIAAHARLMFRNKCGVMTVTLKSTLTRTPDWCSGTALLWWLWRALCQGHQTDDCEELYDKDTWLMTVKSTLTRTPDWCSGMRWRCRMLWRPSPSWDRLTVAVCDDCEEYDMDVVAHVAAHARLMFRNEVTVQDAVVAVTIMESSMQVRPCVLHLAWTSAVDIVPVGILLSAGRIVPVSILLSAVRIVHVSILLSAVRSVPVSILLSAPKLSLSASYCLQLELFLSASYCLQPELSLLASYCLQLEVSLSASYCLQPELSPSASYCLLSDLSLSAS